MKKPIEWHEECAQNAVESQGRRLEKMVADLAEYTRAAEELAFHHYQIGEAKRLGKKEFDADKFLLKRKAKA